MTAFLVLKSNALKYIFAIGCMKIIFSASNSFMHMFNMSVMTELAKYQIVSIKTLRQVDLTTCMHLQASARLDARPTGDQEVAPYPPTPTHGLATFFPDD